MFKELFTEAKIQNKLKNDTITGELKTIIWIEGVPTDKEDETTIYTSIKFNGKTWSIDPKLTKLFDGNKAKKEIIAAIETIITKSDKYFDENNDETWTVDKDQEFEIALSKSVYKGK